MDKRSWLEPCQWLEQICHGFSVTSAFMLKQVSASIFGKTVPGIMILPEVIFVLGGPGSGKGTQCARITEQFPYYHVSAGELLRKERAQSNSQLGHLIDFYMREGKIVPADITCSLLEAEMSKISGLGQQKFLIDGFPRNKDNVEGWEKNVGDKATIRLVLCLDCPEEMCLERCKKRGEGGSLRVDDNEETLVKRIKNYNLDTKPIVDFYDAKKMVAHVDASRDRDTVFENVRKIFLELEQLGDFCIDLK